MTFCVLCSREQNGSFPYPGNSKSKLFQNLEVSYCSYCDFGWVSDVIGVDRLVEYYSVEYPVFAGRSDKPSPSDYFPIIDVDPDPTKDWLRWLTKIKSDRYSQSFRYMHKPHRQMMHLCYASSIYRKLNGYGLPSTQHPAPSTQHPAPLTILDIGTGFGNCLYFAKTFFWKDVELLAYEPDETMMPYLHHIGAKMVTLEAIKSSSVDIVFSSQSMEHVEVLESIRIMSEIRRVLRPKGILSLEVPNVSFKTHACHHSASHEPHLLFFSIQSLRRFVEKFNFSAQLLETNAPIPEGFGVTQWKLFRQRLAHGVRIGERRFKIIRNSWRIHPNGAAILVICSVNDS
ncbi:MAG: class I SAM-dependent methyltransferase [Magnetococcus sp. YQC-5]